MENQQLKAHFGEALRALRVSKNKTQEFVARELGVSLKTYCLWDRGQKLPTLDKYFLLINFFGPALHLTIYESFSPTKPEQEEQPAQ